MKAVLMFRDPTDKSPFDQMYDIVLTCKSIEEVTSKFSTAPDINKVLRIFEFAVDPNSKFVEVRKLCTEETQLRTVSKMHMERNFPSAHIAAEHIKQTYRSSARRRVPGGGTVGKLLVENYWDHIIKFLEEPKPNETQPDEPRKVTEADIMNHFAGDDQRVAMLMFQALVSNASQYRFFIEFRKDPVDRVAMAIQHAKNPFTNREEVMEFLAKDRKLRSLSPTRGTSYVSFSPTGSKASGDDSTRLDLDDDADELADVFSALRADNTPPSIDTAADKTAAAVTRSVTPPPSP